MSAKARAQVWAAVREQATPHFEDLSGHIQAFWDYEEPEGLEAAALDVWRRGRMWAIASHLTWLGSGPADLEDEEMVRWLLGQLLDMDLLLTELRRVLFRRIGVTDT